MLIYANIGLNITNGVRGSSNLTTYMYICYMNCVMIVLSGLCGVENTFLI